MRYVLFLNLLLFSSNAYSSPAEEPKEFKIPILDSAYELIGAQANFAANRLDSFFATQRADDEFGRSRIRIRSRFHMQEREHSTLKNQYQINLKLPHLEQRFRYDFNKDIKNKDKSKAEVKELSESQRLQESWIFNADMGVTAAIPPKLTTRARIRKSFTTGTLIHRFVEQLTYVTDASGFEEETQLNTDHVYSEDLLFRFINTKTWEITQKHFSTNHGPTWLHRVSEDDAFIYGAYLFSKIEKGVWFVNNYRLSLDYRRNLYKQWVYFDIVPGLDFPKKWSFRRTPFISFQIELLFGK